MAAFLSAQSISGFQSAYMVAPNTYTVTYRDPSGTHQDVTNSDVTEGSATPAAPAWTRTGYTLTGWNPARASTVTANVTYSAVWTANTYQIEWVDPSGTNATVTNSATYGSTTPTPPAWTRPGYEFGSWIPSVSPTVTKNQQYMAQWATAGSGKLPVTLDRMRVWADTNGYPAGSSITNADKTVLTYAQLAEMAGGTGGAMAADGSEYVTLEQFREWANSGGGGGGSPLDAYPVGSIYLSTSSTSPATLFGGTWQRIQDRFLLCAGSTYAAGKTGGEATHTLTVAEMPSHSHSFTMYSDNYGESYYNRIPGNGSAGARSVTTTSNGGGAAHNNMPPYLSVYAWKRTA